MKASLFSFKTATIMALAGIGMGIGMAASHDHSLMPVHAHLNLLGWVSLFLFGIYYKLNPKLMPAACGRSGRRVDVGHGGADGGGAASISAMREPSRLLPSGP